MVLDSVHWNEPDFPILYPNVKLRREKGRPWTTRLRNEMDEGAEHQPRPLCSLCRQEGHNRRTCPIQIVVGSTSGQTEWPNISIQPTSVDWLDCFYFIFFRSWTILLFCIIWKNMLLIPYATMFSITASWIRVYVYLFFIFCVCLYIYIYILCIIV